MRSIAVKSKVRVELHSDCVANGGREEYPDGRIGTVVVPDRFFNQAGSGENRRERAEALYAASAPVNKESLTFVGFNQPFIVKGNHKTSREGRWHGMWIPTWLLRPIEAI